MEKTTEKCPECGKPRPAFATQCPYCNYDFPSVNSKVIEELDNKFSSIGNDENVLKRKSLQLDVIRSFAIPQIKEEILDLLVYIQPKATAKNSEVTAEWRIRQQELINRAKMAFANDYEVLLKVNEYEKELEKLKKQVVRQWWQKSSIFAKIAVIFAALLILLIIIPAKDISPEAYAVRFAEAVENKNLDKALDHLAASPEMGELISEQYLTLIDELIAEGRIVEAENLYGNLGSYVNKTNNQNHLSKTSANLINYFLENGNIDKANQYAIDASGITTVLKYLIQNDDKAAAIKYYKKHSTKITRYDSSARRRVLIEPDEVVDEFIKSVK